MPRTTMGLLLLLLQVVLLSAAARAQTAQAWGKEGHYMTCKIADALLPSCANGELTEVCAWADSQRFRYRWSSPLHFADTPGDCKFSYATTGESRSNRSSTGSLTPSRHRGRIGTNAVVFFHVDISMLINVLFLIGIVAVIFFHVDISMLPILDCFREWIINFTGECIRYWISSSAQQGLGADTGSWASGAGAGSRLWINTSAAVPGRSSIPLGGAMSGRSSNPWEEERLPQSKDAWEQQRLRGGAPLPAQGRLGEAAPGGAVGGRALPSAWSRGRWAEVEDDPDRDDPDRDFKLAIGGVIWSF